jgi:hypothetical protein
MRSPVLLPLTLLLVCAFGHVREHARAQGTVDTRFRLTVLLRAAAYERGVQTRSGAFVAAVATPTGEGADEAAAALRQLNLLRRAQVAGRDMTVLRLPADNGATLRGAITETHTEFVYFPAGTRAVQRAAAPFPRGTIVACAVPEDLGSSCFLSVEPHGAGARLVVHLPLARAAGVQFDSRMLQLARVVR